MDEIRREKKKGVRGRVLALVLCLAMLCVQLGSIAPTYAMAAEPASEITVELKVEEPEQSANNPEPASDPQPVKEESTEVEQQADGEDETGTADTSSSDAAAKDAGSPTEAASGEQSDQAEGDTEQQDSSETGDAQKEPTVAKPEFSFSAELDGVKIHIHAADGILPEGTSAKVRRLADDVLDAAAQSIRDWSASKTLVQLIGFEISFFDADGAELHQFDRKIKISYSGLTFAEDAQEMQVFHADADGEVTEALTNVLKISEEVEFSSDQFSPILLAVYGRAADAADEQTGDADTGDGAADEQTGDTDTDDGAADEQTGDTDANDGIDSDDGAADEQTGDTDTGDGAADEQTGDTDTGDGIDTGDGTADEQTGGEEEPAPVLTEQTVEAAVYADATYSAPYGEQVSIVLTGALPEGVAVKAYPVSVELGDENLTVVVAYDISLFVTVLDETTGELVEQEYEPESPVAVSISSDALEALESVSIYHIDNVNGARPGSQPELVRDGVCVENTRVSFDADRFSIYALATTYASPNPKIWWGTISLKSNASSEATDKNSFTADNETTAKAKVASVYISGPSGSGVVGYGGSATKGSALNNLTTSTVTRDGVYGTSTSATATVSVTPKQGYYVTNIIVGCVDGDSSTCFNCQTWGREQAFASTFSLGDGNSDGTVSTTIAKSYFSHGSPAKHYVIMIAVAPIPTPLYVEYDYGSIGDYLTINESPFSTASEWTSANTANVYQGASSGNGNDGGIQTANTQYKYTYADGKQSEVSNWKHYANTITDAAKEAAAQVGYYFAGWEAQYYEKVTATPNASGSYNNYTYSFSSDYGQTVTYAEGAAVNLITNVRLVAKWQPYTVTVTKVVAGSTEDVDLSALLSQAQTYNISLSDGNSSKDYPCALTVTSSSTNYTESTTISPVIPGSYAVSEDKANQTITVGGTTYYCSTSYDANTLEITRDDIKNHVSKSVTVTNTYSKEPPAVDITIEKKVTGTMGDVNRSFSFNYSYVKDGATVTGTFDLVHNGTTTISDIPIGVELTLTEENTGYDTSAVYGSGDPLTATNGSMTFTINATDDKIVVTNHKDATPDTGVILDTLPYILILAAVIICAILFIRRRRNRRDD